MIIISQDRKMIINFENIVGVIIRKNTDENIYQIQCKSENEKNKRILGKYETEERAKEILKEICLNYEKWKNLEVFNGNIEIGFSRPVYEMPKE